MSTPRNVRWFELLLSLLMVAAGCGGAVTDVTPVTPPDTVVRSLVPNPPKVTIETGGPFGLPSCKGRSAPLGVIAKNGNGSILNPDVRWTSSDSTLIPVNHATGMAESKDVVGKVIATATASGLTAPVEVEVVRSTTCRDTVASVKIVASDSTPIVVDGSGRQLSAKMIPDSADQTAVWSSKDTITATVDQSGHVTAYKPGIATICATSKNGKVGCFTTSTKFPDFVVTPMQFELAFGQGCVISSQIITSQTKTTFTTDQPGFMRVTRLDEYRAKVVPLLAGGGWVWAVDIYNRRKLVIVSISPAPCS